jgi:hypothetical protein
VGLGLGLGLGIRRADEQLERRAGRAAGQWLWLQVRRQRAQHLVRVRGEGKG